MLRGSEFWRGRRVLLTGHTGFKGTWASLWLARLGAEVTGLSLEPEGDPNAYALVGAGQDVLSTIIDISDRAGVAAIVARARPEIVIHMAAQSLVRRSVREPVETIATNVMGTVHLLDALRDAESLKTALIVTSDKVYANDGSRRRFAETDSLGGKDPYAGSKAAAELVTRCFAQSFFVHRGVRVATVRAGNVIGGGDFGEDRIIPDCVRAMVAGERLVLRHPEATRPWQHVLDCLSGYIAYAEVLSQEGDVSPALNVGPLKEEAFSVSALVEMFFAEFGLAADWNAQTVAGSVEAPALCLDASLAASQLGWKPKLDTQAAIRETARWYKAWTEGQEMRSFTLDQISAYEAADKEAVS